MGHFLVFAFLIITLGGAWTALSAWQRYRATGVELFRSLFWFLLSFNLMVFGCFVARYAHTNLIGDAPAAYGPAVWIGSAAGAFLIELRLIWTILRLGHELRGEPASRRVVMVFAILAAFLGISYVIGSTLALQGGFPLWIVGTHQAMSLFLVLGFGFTVFGLVVRRLPNLNSDQRRSARRFGWLLLVGLVFFPASFALPASSYLVGFAAGMLWLCFTPLIWMRLYSCPFEPTIAPGAADAALTLLARKHDITPREQEIMELIMVGKSNKEIEDLLCISFSTVKNHVYNLYRKLGINSRTQLIHLVMVEGARREKVQSGGKA